MRATSSCVCSTPRFETCASKKIVSFDQPVDCGMLTLSTRAFSKPGTVASHAASVAAVSSRSRMSGTMRSRPIFAVVYGARVADRKGQKAPPREKPQQIADELRALIVGGELSEGDSLGHEPDLVERFGVSRPSLREALRILEAEGLITVVRGVLGGVVVHEPDERMTARAAALVLQARNVPLADVYDARSLIEPTAARVVAASRSRRSAAAELRKLIDEQERRDRRPGSVRCRERAVPRAARRAGRESDAAHRRGDVERDRGARGDRGRAVGRRPATASRPAAAASGRSGDWPT